jgi:hypothetical protein
VSLANYKNPADATGLTYAALREAQTQTLALPNTGQALAIDVGGRRRRRLGDGRHQLRSSGGGGSSDWRRVHCGVDDGQRRGVAARLDGGPA